jgi:hypothetical protein
MGHGGSDVASATDWQYGDSAVRSTSSYLDVVVLPTSQACVCNCCIWALTVSESR